MSSPTYSSEQQQLHKELKAKIVSQNSGRSDSISKFLSEEDLYYRYLKARNWNLKKATDMLQETIKWRSEFKPEQITKEEISPILETGIQYLNGHDREYSPIVYIKPGPIKVFW